MKKGAAEVYCKQWYNDYTHSFRNGTDKNDINHPSYLLLKKNSAKEIPKPIW